MAKKKLVLLLAAVLLCRVAAFPALADSPSFTLLIYLCGTDLETDGGSASMDIYEMLDAGLDPDGDIRVVVETGGAKEWIIDEINPTQNERWAVVGNRFVCYEELPRRDMGDYQTLESFVAYGIENYPADRYGLILWNHGGGSTTGICFDEYTGNYLTTQDIYDALSGVREDAEDFRLDFIGFDACLMGTFEMANYVKDFADYMVASEELAPSLGWDYEALLSTLAENPAIETRALCESIVDAFMETNLKNDPDDCLTLSVLNLGAMDALTTELEKISAGLSAALANDQLRTLSRFRQNMRSFGDFSQGNASDMVDLQQLLEVFSEDLGLPADAALQALRNVVAYNRYTENNLENIGGISILMPLKTRSEFPQYSAHYDGEALFPGYTAFISDFTQQLSGGDYIFALSQPVQVVGGIGLTTPQAGASQGAPVMDENGYLTYSLTLSGEDLSYLAYAEGNLMIDISDEETEAYIDLGYLQSTFVDWEEGTVYSLFDGTWPMLEGQIVSITDQIVTGSTRRSLIDATVNGVSTYLLVIFDESRPGGEVIGYTKGYTDSGAPARGHQKLKPGDVVVPTYYLLYYDEDGEQQSDVFEGDPILVGDAPLSFGYGDLAGLSFDFAYAFCLNDIFGEYQFSDFIFFSL